MNLVQEEERRGPKKHGQEGEVVIQWCFGSDISDGSTFGDLSNVFSWAVLHSEIAEFYS